jgi:hypothetical protein
MYAMALCLMVGGGTNLRFFLLVEGTQGRSLENGFTSNKLGDDSSSLLNILWRFFQFP